MNSRHNLRVIAPAPEDREIVHRIIYEELCLGVVKPQSRTGYRRIMGALASEGAQAIILGCTAISLPAGQQDSQIPLLDTALHAKAAVDEALG